MTALVYVMWGIAVLILIFGVIAIYAFRIQREEYKKTGKHPKGHYMGLGMAMGIAIGMPLGIAMENIAIGPAIGVSIGVAMGAALEKRHEKELRPLTPREERLRGITMLILGLSVLAGVIVFALTYNGS